MVCDEGAAPCEQEAGEWYKANVQTQKKMNCKIRGKALTISVVVLCKVKSSLVRPRFCGEKCFFV
jgi:hypothetical protein